MTLLGRCGIWCGCRSLLRVMRGLGLGLSRWLLPMNVSRYADKNRDQYRRARKSEQVPHDLTLHYRRSAGVYVS